ncbi:nucleotidyltransferase domain-containing protein [Magnetofaba australis]
MRQTILQKLEEIEWTEEVRILYACESGSRAWGFASPDSDWDVRFIYVRPPEWYLSVDVERKRDVIERPITDDLDINGWDLRKALWLMGKSNPGLLEWLASPIVYREDGVTPQRLRALRDECFSPRAAWHHYVSMAHNNLRESLQGETVRLKKYFYVLRPLLAARWVARGMGAPPVLFEDLLSGVLEEQSVRNAIDDLTRRKRQSGELDAEPRIPVLHEFIDTEFAWIERESATLLDAMPADKPLAEPLNRAFREIIDQAA